jgi:hypothetical protein
VHLTIKLEQFDFLKAKEREPAAAHRRHGFYFVTQNERGD